jgi:predicted nucleic acid-binding protein
LLGKRSNWGWAIRVSSYTVLLDACVLYPAPLRDLLMELASRGLFRAKWTNQIHEEWISALLRNRKDLQRSQLERTRDLMNSSVYDCLVTEFEDLIPSIVCPDENDRHVIAAAIKGNCAAIITFDINHFPSDELGKYDLEVRHPDEFLYHQLGLDKAAFLTAARAIRLRLKNPPLSAAEYLRRLEAQSLPKTVAELSQYSTVI